MYINFIAYLLSKSLALAAPFLRNAARWRSLRFALTEKIALQIATTKFSYSKGRAGGNNRFTWLERFYGWESLSPIPYPLTPLPAAVGTIKRCTNINKISTGAIEITEPAATNRQFNPNAPSANFATPKGSV